MEEKEFEEKLKKGEIEEVKEERPEKEVGISKEETVERILRPKLEDYIPLLEELRRPKSKVRAYRATSNQTIAHDTDVKVQFNAETYDVLSDFDSVTNFRYTAKKKGYRFIYFQVRFVVAVADKVYGILIRKNGAGAGRCYIHSSNTSFITPSVTDKIYLNTGDYLEFYAYHNAGVDQALLAAQEDTYVIIEQHNDS